MKIWLKYLIGIALGITFRAVAGSGNETFLQIVDFLSKAEIEFLTGRKQKSLVIEQLNAMGIPFMQNANGYPIVRRDYDKVKSRTAKTESQDYKNNAWRPSVLQA